MIDAAEQYLNEHRLQRPHLAGNSMGGFVALELARRGRAETVCALSPGGFWSAGDGLRARAMNRVKRNAAMGRLTRPVTPLVMKSAVLRRRVMRDVAWHGIASAPRMRSSSLTTPSDAPSSMRFRSAMRIGSPRWTRCPAL